MARVTVLVTSTPFGNRRATEALRMSVGQTLADNEVRLILAEDAVYILGEAEPELVGGGQVKRPLETLRMLGHTVYGESESLDERGLADMTDGFERVTRADVARMLLESDVVLTW